MAIVRAYLTMIGKEFNPDLVTDLLNITPDQVRTPLEILPNGNYFHHTEWGIETARQEVDDVETVIRQLLDRVSGRLDDMAAVAESVSAQWHVLVCVKSGTSDFPYIIFSAQTICELAKIKAQMGFDTYLHTEG